MKTKKLSLGLTLFMLMGATLTFAQEGGDGEVSRVAKLVQKTGLLCEAGTAGCPIFPPSLSLKRAEMIHKLQDLTGCAEHLADEKSILSAGSAESVTQALSHMVLADGELSLHAKKMAIELIAKLNAKTSVNTLEMIFERSSQIVRPVFAKQALAQKARDEKVQRQSEELRRIVVLAAGQRAGAERLLARAATDSGRSVALTAQRLRAR